MTISHSMDFFQQQENAIRSSRRLFIGFLLALICIVAFTCVSVLMLTPGRIFYTKTLPELYQTYGLIMPLWKPEVWPLIKWSAVLHLAGIITFTMGGVSAIKSLRLKQSGGSGIAELLGGQLVTGVDQRLEYKQVYNVVQEMAIASGVNVPKTYVLSTEKNINAFAAGFSVDDAVICVTEGACKELSRDELQGVVAHEFSHILYGDMRLNLQLISTLAGLMLFISTGVALVRFALKDSVIIADWRSILPFNPIAIPAFFGGMCFTVIGTVGHFFARIIQASVSRHREFLADAAAVQFTRNPMGIGKALIKVGKTSSEIDSYLSVELGHMFFAASAYGWTNLFSTHPQVRQRLARIDKRLIGLYDNRSGIGTWSEKVQAKNDQMQARGIFSNQAKAGGFAHDKGKDKISLAENLTSGPLQTTEPSLTIASAFLAALPTPVKLMAREPYSARALVLISVLNFANKDIASKQLALLERLIDKDLANQIKTLWPDILHLGISARLPLIEMALPTLKGLINSQKNDLVVALQKIIEVDGRISISEFIIVRLVRVGLFGRYKINAHVNKLSFPLAAQTALVFMAHAAEGLSHDNKIEAFSIGMKALELKPVWPTSTPPLSQLNAALTRLDSLPPNGKKMFITACVQTISYNHSLSVHEEELLRVVCDAIGVPVPMCVGKLSIQRSATNH